MFLRRLLQQSSLYLLSNLASRAVGFLMIPLYARSLSPAEYGLIELIELTIQIVAIGFGLQTVGGAMVRIYHEAAADQKNEVVSTGILSALLASLAVGGMGMLASSGVLWHWKGGPDAGLLQASFLAMVTSNVVEAVLTYHRLKDRVGLYVFYSLAQLLATVGLNILFIVDWRWGVWGFVASKLVVTGLGSVWLLGSALRQVGVRWSGTAARRMLQFGTPLILAQISFFVIHFADRFFLGAYTDLTTVGAYALAYRFAFLVTLMVGEPFGKVWSISLYSYTEAGWEARFAQVARYLAFALSLAGLGLALFGDDVVRLMATPPYYAATAVLPVLVLGYVAREVGDFFRNVLYINKRTSAVGGIAFASSVCNLLLNFALIPRYGMAGAAWATLLTWVFYLVGCWARAQREHAIPFPVKAFTGMMLLGTAVYAAAEASPALPALWQWGAQLLWLGVFVGLLWAGGYFPRQDCVWMKGKLTGVWGGLSGVWSRQRA